MPNFLNISQFYANFFEFLYKYKNYSLSLHRNFVPCHTMAQMVYVYYD